jgi:hypothetical protein
MYPKSSSERVCQHVCELHGHNIIKYADPDLVLCTKCGMTWEEIRAHTTAKAEAA